MTMVSYAQNREDVLLARLFPPGVPGFYVDVGANDPTVCSVTRHFYDHGWCGINIEPSERAFTRLAAERPRDINIHAGVSDAAGSAAFFEFAPPWTGASTFGPEQASYHQARGHPFVERDVEVTTLATICSEHVDRTIDFMSIDVEGHEVNVIRGADWSRWRPRVLVVEATVPTTPVPSHAAWEPQLLEAGYVFATFDGLNRYYVRQEDRGLADALSSPVSVLDDYVTHELVSCRSELAASRALLQSLREQFGALPEELRSLQARYLRLERVSARTRSELAPIQAVVDHAQAAASEARARCEQLEQQSAALSDRWGPLESLGPRSLQLALGFRRAADRFPRTTATARRALAAARRRSRGDDARR